MENSFKKSNFALWVKIALYASRDKDILVPYTDKFMNNNKSKIHDMFWEGYFKREVVKFMSVATYRFIITDKFREEFKDKYCEISKSIRPDFTDEKRNTMLNAFNL